MINSPGFELLKIHFTAVCLRVLIKNRRMSMPVTRSEINALFPKWEGVNKQLTVSGLREKDR